MATLWIVALSDNAHLHWLMSFFILYLEVEDIIPATLTRSYTMWKQCISRNCQSYDEEDVESCCEQVRFLRLLLALAAVTEVEKK